MDNYSLSLAINYLILFIREHLLSTGAVPRSVLRAGDKEEQVESDEVADVSTPKYIICLFLRHRVLFNFSNQDYYTVWQYLYFQFSSLTQSCLTL